MSAYDDPSTPELEAVQQEEADDGRLMVPVRVLEVAGPVRVQVLPSRHGVSRSWTTNATDPEPVPLLGADLRRRRASIVATGAAVYVGEREMVKAGAAALWPADVPLIVEHTEQLYARAATGTATVSVVSENWAD